MGLRRGGFPVLCSIMCAAIACCMSPLSLCLYSLHESARVNEISVENIYNFQSLSLFHGWDKCFFYDLWVSACLKLITFIATLQMTVLCANLTAH